mgnify:CR=1 FL=1
MVEGVKGVVEFNTSKPRPGRGGGGGCCKGRSQGREPGAEARALRVEGQGRRDGAKQLWCKYVGGARHGWLQLP